MSDESKTTPADTKPESKTTTPAAKPATAPAPDAAAAEIHLLPQHDELPRDAQGRVIGVFHVTSIPEGATDERFASSLEGDLIDRALSHGCAIAPGPAKKARSRRS